MATKKFYLTATDKKVIRNGLQTLITKVEKKRASIQDTYQRSYLKDTIQDLKKALRTFSNIW